MKSISMLILLVFIFSLSCTQSTTPSYNKDDFGIYLLADTLLTTHDIKEFSIDDLQLQKTAFINLDDIIKYNWEEQVITLTTEANKKFKALDTKQISVYGMPFVVVVENERIYVGNIYPMYSSILQPNFPMIQVAPFIELKILRAMPESTPDKREDERIYKVIKKFKKLSN